MSKHKQYIIVNAIQCLQCGDIIYSRARYDYHYCSCGFCSIDGGFDYIKINVVSQGKITHMKKRVYATRHQLYLDWNHSKNKFGIIKPTKKWIVPPIKQHRTWKEKIKHLIKQILSGGKF